MHVISTVLSNQTVFEKLVDVFEKKAKLRIYEMYFITSLDDIVSRAKV